MNIAAGMLYWTASLASAFVVNSMRQTFSIIIFQVE